MGFAASSARLLMLVARKSDLEFQLQMINQQRLLLTNSMDKIYASQLRRGGVEPDDDFIKEQQVLLKRLQEQDKALELSAQRINYQHEAIQTEIQAVNKVLTNNIQTSFKLMG